MNDSPVDMSKLSERELLILLNERVGNISEKLERVSKDHYILEREVDKITTRNKTISAWWGSLTVLLSLIINAFRILK